jgi:hypothetical protein
VAFAADDTVLALGLVRNVLQMLGLRIQIINVQQMAQSFL